MWCSNIEHTLLSAAAAIRCQLLYKQGFVYRCVMVVGCIHMGGGRQQPLQAHNHKQHMCTVAGSIMLSPWPALVCSFCGLATQTVVHMYGAP